MIRDAALRMAIVSSTSKLSELIELKLLKDVNIEVHSFLKSEALIAAHLDDQLFDALVFEMDSGTGALLKFCAVAQLKTPIVLISNEPIPQQLVYPDLRIFANVNMQEFVERFPSIILSAVARDESQTQSIREGFLRIRTEFIAEMSPLVSDVFIRFSGGRMIKVFKKGANFGAAEVDRYISRKKLHYLYVRKEDSEILLKKLQGGLEASIDRLLQGGTNSAEVLVMAHETAHELYHKVGFTPEVEALIHQVVSRVTEDVESNPKLSDAWQSLCSDESKFLSTHSILTGQLACALASKMEWPSETTLSKLVFAAFFHDFDLQTDSLGRLEVDHRTAEHCKTLAADLRERFWLHPMSSSSALIKLAGMPQDVDVIIDQHHERPDGSGFPRALKALQIAPLAVVFIVAHEFILFLIRNRGDIDFVKFRQENQVLLDSPKFRSCVELLPELIRTKMGGGSEPLKAQSS